MKRKKISGKREVHIKRPLLFVMVALGLGELIAYGQKNITAGVCLLIFLWCRIQYISDRNYITIRRCIFGGIILLVGYFIMQNRTEIYLRAENEFSKGFNRAEGEVTDISRNDSGYGLIVKIPQYGDILIYADDISKVKIGNQIEMEVAYMEFEGARNEGCFDDRSYYHSIGISGRFYGEKLRIKDRGVNCVKEYLHEIKLYGAQLLEQLYSEEKAQIYQAILLGEKSGINEETKELYKGAGIYHLCCISGTHMVILGLGLYKVLRKRFKFAVSGAGAIVVILLYGIMTGMGVSVMRAVIMIMVRIMADIMGRTYDMISSMSAAAIVMILSNPYVIFHSGFLLSFGAVASICAIVPNIEKFYSVKSPWLKSLFFSLGIQMGTFPILAYYYSEVSVYGILINLIAIPMMGDILLSGAAGLAAAMGSISAGRFCAGLGNYGLDFYNILCSAFLKLPMSEYVTGRPEIGKIVIYYVILMAAMILVFKITDCEKEFWEEDWYIRYAKIAGGIALAVLMCAVLLVKENSGITIRYIDVGQGDSTLIQTDTGMEYLIDAGSSDVTDVGTYRILPVLKASGVNQLEYLIVTHTDSDHINGIAALLEERTGSKNFVKTLVFAGAQEQDEECQALRQLAGKNGVDIAYISAGQGWKGRDYELKCIYPDRTARNSDKNELSVVMELSTGKRRLLFMGDLGVDGEEELISCEKIRHCDVLKVGHHGSKNSSSASFLNQAKPHTAIISCGENNSYGHPGEETLQRLKSVGSQVYRTDRNGEIIINIQENVIKVDSYIK